MKAWQTGRLTVLSLQRDCRRSPLPTNPTAAVLPRSTPIFAILTETTTPKNIPLCAAATTPLDKGGQQVCNQSQRAKYNWIKLDHHSFEPQAAAAVR